MKVSIVREPDDSIADARISLGSPKGTDDFYVVFRGSPDKVISLMRRALFVAERAIPAGKYKDQR